MGRRFILLALILPLVAPALVGCGNTPPYIYNKDEFNREAVGFGQEPEDRDTVYICYSKRSTTPEAVRKMAQDECAKYDKVAVYRKQDILYCPVMTPARALFDCVPRQQPASQSLFAQ